MPPAAAFSVRPGKDCACSESGALPASQGGRPLPESGFLADSPCSARLVRRASSCSLAGAEDGQSSAATFGAREERPRRSTLPTREGLPLKDFSAFLQYIRALASAIASSRHDNAELQHSTALYWCSSRQEALSFHEAGGRQQGRLWASSQLQHAGRLQGSQPENVCRAHFCRGEGVAALDLSSILKGPGVRGVPCAAASAAAAGAGDGCEGGREASLTLCKAPAANAMPQVGMTCRIILLLTVVHPLEQLLGL